MAVHHSLHARCRAPNYVRRLGDVFSEALTLIDNMTDICRLPHGEASGHTPEMELRSIIQASRL